MCWRASSFQHQQTPKGLHHQMCVRRLLALPSPLQQYPANIQHSDITDWKLKTVPLWWMTIIYPLLHSLFLSVVQRLIGYLARERWESSGHFYNQRCDRGHQIWMQNTANQTPSLSKTAQNTHASGTRRNGIIHKGMKGEFVSSKSSYPSSRLMWCKW